MSGRIEFADNTGQTWAPVITVPALRDASRALGLNLKQLTQVVLAFTAAKAGGGKINLDAIMAEVGGLDVADLLELPYYTVKRECLERKLTKDQFLERLGPAQLAGVLSACAAALTRDFPGAGDAGGGVAGQPADPTGAGPTS